MERIQKRIAASGFTSRRKAEELILQGRVKVNGILVNTLGEKVGAHDEITIDDIVLMDAPKQYYVLYKPRGVISSVKDEFHRRTVIDILPEELKNERLFPVGRLDYDTKGIILLTNDGDFMNEMVGPQSGIQKEYLVRIAGLITTDHIAQIEQGVLIGRKKTLPAFASIESLDNKNKSSLVQLTITEGMYHQVKEMFKALGYDVKRLTRVRFGNIKLDGLQEGEIRHLTIHELKTLHELAKKSKILSKTDATYRYYS